MSASSVGGRGTHYCPRCQPRRGGMSPARGAGSARRAAALGQTGRAGAPGRRAPGCPAGEARLPAVRWGRRSVPAAPRLYIVLTASLGAASWPSAHRHGRVRRAAGTPTWAAPCAARRARVARHLAREKPLRWHADYLFTAFPARAAPGWWTAPPASASSPARWRRCPARRAGRAASAPATAAAPATSYASRAGPCAATSRPRRTPPARLQAGRYGPSSAAPPRPSAFVLSRQQASRSIPRCLGTRTQYIRLLEPRNLLKP